tara:strand:- start:2286 stop:2606 length:321 start_codon:yes stop_codon:yes gene_type:complete
MEITNFKVGQELTAQKSSLLFVQYYSKLVVPEGARIIWISEEFRIQNCNPSSEEVSGTSKAGKAWSNTKHTCSVALGEDSILLSWMGKDITSCLGTHFVCYSDIKS